MNKLIAKEIKLTASPLSFFFIAFSLMTLIPGYPILLGAFFVCLGIFQTFQKAREENDIIYSTILPIKKKDIVTSKFIFVCMIESIAYACMVIFALLRLFVLNKSTPYAENQMLNSNLVFLGLVLFVFAFFNIFFVGGFFKTAYKIGKPFIIFVAIVTIIVVASEVLWRIPHLEFLNQGYHYSHSIVLGVGILTFVVGTCLSHLKSQKCFEKLDL